MKRIQCEVCGSSDIIKNVDNVFQCGHCGCRYSPDGAKQLYSESRIKETDSDFVIDRGVLKAYRGESIDVVVPDNARIIGQEAFLCSEVRSIILPDRIKVIEEFAFADCTELISVRLPARLQELNDFCFSGCSSLESIAIPEGVTSIPSEAFKDCTALASVSLPDGIASICDHAFRGCSSLQKINIPAGIKTIESGAFQDCVSLKNVYIPDGCVCYPDTFSGCDMSEISTQQEREKEYRRRQNLCQHCGGKFKGLFRTACSVCGRPKDY